MPWVESDGHFVIPIPGARLPKAKIDISDDRNGLFIYPAESSRGKVEWGLSVKLHVTNLGARLPRNPPPVFGIETVFVPKDGFILGDPGPNALGFGSFYRSKEGGPAWRLVRYSEPCSCRGGKRG